MSQVQQFYAGKSIFITGATGFVGKCLTEKLLRGCPDIRTVYLLIRSKRGKTFQERVQSFLDDPVLEVLRGEYPDFARKVVGVKGDISEERLGLSSTDYERIVNEVSIIFHSAATVRFNETLDRAVTINVNSTKCIVDIARACKNLEAAIYVSTAFSHCVRDTIREELYPPPLSYERANQIIEDIRKKSWSKEETHKYTEEIIGDWPNTYSFTKAIAEGVVIEYAKDLPFAIFRPSVVLNSYREPMPGWVYGRIGVPALICAGGLGILKVGLVDSAKIAEVVPVDYVCNGLICSAWETAIAKERSAQEIPVYNYVSGPSNPITWGKILSIASTYGRIFPSNSAIYYECAFFTKWVWLYNILHILLNFIPAIIYDNIGKLYGKEPGMYKAALKIDESLRTMAYFAFSTFHYNDERVQNLWKRIGPQDRAIFPFNIRNLDWNEHSMKMARGIWKYMVREADGSEEEAKRRQFYLYTFHTIIRLSFAAFVLWIIFLVWGWIMSTR